MDLLPLFHNLRDRRCVMVGGGEIALRKLRQLMAVGAAIEVIAPEINSSIQKLAHESGLTLVNREFEDADLNGAVLVVAATNDIAVNRRVSELAQARNIPVNVVDNPELCSVIFPSIVDRSPVQIAISSAGTAPVLARMLRTRLESSIPAGYGKLAAIAGKYRDHVKRKINDGLSRKAFWEEVFEGDIAELVYAEKLDEAESRIQQKLANPASKKLGEVYLVGGGPGDPDLLTFRALRLMQKADIVLYDRLVSKEVLALVRRDAELVYVGKTAGDHPVTQDNINEKLAEYALQGKRVLRLKGGDPFIFGRGGEEISHLAERGIPFQVVPGITAASGCASYAGIPLTHRDYAQSVRFITGHLKDNSLDLNWQDLVAANQTLVFYMGLSGLESICRELIRRGKTPTTPAALIEKGTTVNQRVFIGDLKTLPDIVREANAKAPTLIIVGDVVKLNEKLSWFKP
ncbi:siroheme synthase CysG [uncultured Porticoccus sp.]|uniref:siroheme synthase CysG n=1 Tax=uncultured Porticoccus sp. TaxID=1256050 RepID=UPI00260351D7|nr:siroheme synthase CysG [uncultured Porticoccus sp.]